MTSSGDHVSRWSVTNTQHCIKCAKCPFCSAVDIVDIKCKVALFKCSECTGALWGVIGQINREVNYCVQSNCQIIYCRVICNKLCRTQCVHRMCWRCCWVTESCGAIAIFVSCNDWCCCSFNPDIYFCSGIVRAEMNKSTVWLNCMDYLPIHVRKSFSLETITTSVETNIHIRGDIHAC